MQLIVTTNWDDKFLDGLDPAVVSWVSGRLPRDEIGGSSIFPGNMAKRINRKGVEKYIKLIHKRGFKFNYLLDGHCTSNKEYSYRGANRMLENIRWISDSGADGITVVLPHLVEIIKRDYPRMKVGFGGSRVVWEITRIKYFDGLGVDWIILHSASHRSFRALRAMRSAVKCELWLVANTGCLLFCNFGYDHDNYLAHASNYTAAFSYTDYFHLNCNKIILQKPEELIKCPWIRPEDLCVYENLGYDKFFILPNSSKTSELLKIANAYKTRKYDGNLLDILSAMGKKMFQSRNGWQEEGVPVLDNSKLGSAIKFFINKKEECFRMLCSECGYCKEVAKKAVIFPQPRRIRRLINKYQRDIERIEDGK
ncbi:MAG: hypothetical protein AB1481_04570 [Candidatus Omnitrophota bacterium]